LSHNIEEKKNSRRSKMEGSVGEKWQQPKTSFKKRGKMPSKGGGGGGGREKEDEGWTKLQKKVRVPPNERKRARCLQCAV